MRPSAFLVSVWLLLSAGGSLLPKIAPYKLVPKREPIGKV
jgi:hypothetical protein